MAPPYGFDSEHFLPVTEILDAKLNVSIWTHAGLEECSLLDAPGIGTARKTYSHLSNYITQHFCPTLALSLPSDVVPGTIPDDMAGLHDVRMIPHLLGRRCEDGPTEVGGIHCDLDPLALVVTVEDATQEDPTDTIGTIAGLYVPVVANNNSLLHRKNADRDEIYINIHWIPADSCLKHPEDDSIWVRPNHIIVPTLVSPGNL